MIVRAAWAVFAAEVSASVAASRAAFAASAVAMRRLGGLFGGRDGRLGGPPPAPRDRDRLLRGAPLVEGGGRRLPDVVSSCPSPPVAGRRPRDGRVQSIAG